MSLTTYLALVPLVPWIALIAVLLLRPWGQTYLRSVGGQSAIAEAVAAREMGLAFVGLVLAGFAISTVGGDPVGGASELLAMALAGAVIAWTVSNLAGSAWSSIVAGAGLLVSVSAVLMAVVEILEAAGGIGLPSAVAIGLAYLVALAYGTMLALVHFDAARSSTDDSAPGGETRDRPVPGAHSTELKSTPDGHFCGEGDLAAIELRDKTGKSPKFRSTVVAFSPATRTHWHSHGQGQILFVLSGEGWHQEEGKEPQRLRPGDAVSIEAPHRHWHGATADDRFEHVAVSIGKTEWAEASAYPPVTARD